MSSKSALIGLGAMVVSGLIYAFWPQIVILYNAFSNRFNF